MAVIDADFAAPPVRVEPDPNRFKALAVIAIAQLMIVLDATVVTIALPSAQKALGLSVNDRQWVLTAYTLAFGGLLLLGGRIADYLGRKRMFVLSLLGFAGASALGGLAQNSTMLFAARALQGAMAAVMAPSALSLIQVTFTEPKERARAFGVFGGISGGGAAIGLILGGLLTQYVSWRWTLLINVPIAIGAAFFATRLVSESRAERRSTYDIPGALTSTLGLLALVYGFTKAETDHWGSATTLSFVIVGVVLLVVFALIEWRTRNPLLPLRVVADRNRGGSFLSTLLLGIGLFATFLFLTYYFQQVLGYSAVKTGFAFLPFSVGIVAGATIASQLLPRIGPRPLIFGGLLLATGGLIVFAQVGTDVSYLTQLLPAELMTSIGVGTAFVPLSSTALIGVEPSDAGVASALVNTAQQTGGTLGVAFLNTVAAAATTNYLAAHHGGGSVTAAAAVHGYTVGFSISAGLLGGAAVLALLLLRAQRSDLSEDVALAVA
jgi:EmrB/QacA subfamily drug resistance transporter